MVGPGDRECGSFFLASVLQAASLRGILKAREPWKPRLALEPEPARLRRGTPGAPPTNPASGILDT